MTRREGERVSEKKRNVGERDSFLNQLRRKHTHTHLVVNRESYQHLKLGR